MKKLVSILLVLAMCAGLTACQSSKEDNKKSDGPVTLQFWAFQVDKEAKFIEKCVKDFNSSHKDVQVELTFLNQADYTTTLIPTAFANGEAPDVMFVEAAVMDKYANKKMLADLTPYFTDELKKDILPAALDAVTYDDKLLALPFDMEIIGLFYDKDVLDKEGIAVPKTWDELLEAAKKLTTDDRYGLVLPVDKTPYTIYNWWPFQWMKGGEVLNEAKDKSLFNSKENAEALDYWAQFFKNGYSPKTLKIGPYDIGNIGTGAAAMQVSGTYVVNAAETDYKDANIQVAPLPSPDGTNSMSVAGGQKFAVSSSSKHVKEAAEFIMWMYGSDDISRITEWCTETKFAYPVRQSVIEANEEIFHKGMRSVFTDEIYESCKPEPSYPSEVTDILMETLQKACFGDVSGADAVKEADEKIGSVLGQ